MGEIDAGGWRGSGKRPRPPGIQKGYEAPSKPFSFFIENPPRKREASSQKEKPGSVKSFFRKANSNPIPCQAPCRDFSISLNPYLEFSDSEI